jgi:hypothetical protein
MIDRNKHWPVRHFGGHWPIGHWPLAAIIEYIRSLILLNSPAAIIRRFLVNQSRGTMPSSGSEWPIFVSHLPDGEGLDNAICVYDTSPYQHGELSDGQSVEHKGIRLQIRARDYEAGRSKIRDLVTAMNSIQNELVILGVNRYEVGNSVQQYTSTEGQDVQRRMSFVGGFFVSLYRMIPQ